jgi:hypothetical protein
MVDTEGTFVEIQQQAQFVSKKLVVEDQYPRQLYSLEGISYPYSDQDDTTWIE